MASAFLKSEIHPPITMNTTQRHQLIDSDFTADRAAHVLLSLVKSKIDYHNVEKLSNAERFGEDLTHSERRLAELRELRDILRKVCRDAEASGHHLRVKGWLEIETLAPCAASEPAGAMDAAEVAHR